MQWGQASKTSKTLELTESDLSDFCYLPCSMGPGLAFCFYS